MSTSDSTLSPNENLQSVFNTIKSSVKQMTDQGMSRSFSSVATGLQTIMTIVTSNDKRLNVIGDDIAKLDVRFTKVEADVADVKADVAKLDVRFTKVEADVAEIKSLIIAQNKSFPITIMKTVETMAQTAMLNMN